MTKKIRNSSVELLKVIAIIMIIINHVIQTICTQNDSIVKQDYVINISKATNDFQLLLLGFFRYFGVWGNTIFFVCSAWYLYDSQKINLKKWITMIGEIWFVSVTVLIVFDLISDTKINNEIFIKSLIPNIASNNWYMTCYLLFYILHPILNKTISALNEKQLLNITSFLSIIYIGFNFLWEGILFYSPVLLWISIYFIIAYLRKYKQNRIDDFNTNLRILIVGMLLNIGIVALTNYLGLHNDFFSDKIMYWNKNSNPFIIMAVIALFNLIRNIEFSNAIINYVSGLSLFIYIFHENIILRTYVRPYLIIYIHEHLGYDNILFWVIMFALGIFIISLLIGIIYNITVGKAIRKLSVLATDVLLNIQCYIEKCIMRW